MLRVTKLTDYATVLLSEMARVPEAVYTASQLSERASVSVATTSKLLKGLVKAGICDSYRGAEGGYQLAREPKAISIAEIIEAVEGPMALTECGLQEGLCHNESHCQIRPHWQKINAVVRGALSNISLRELCGGESAPPSDACYVARPKGQQNAEY